jgi:hypothetical protein
MLLLSESELLRPTIEPISAIICFILVWFMIKPYRVTGDARFLGLPLGFGIMGIGHIIAATVAISQDVSWIMLLFRTFSFAFLAMTYFFSSKSSKKTQQLWNLTLSAVIVVLIALSLLVVAAPQTVWEQEPGAQIYCRIFIMIFLCYIIVHTLRNHVRNPDPTTILIPFGFIFLAISQYSFIFLYTNSSRPAVWGGLALRLIGLIIFLVVAYRSFYSPKEAAMNEDFT